MSTPPLADETRAAIERLEPADVVIGATACGTAEAAAAAADAAQEAARRISPPPRGVLVIPNTVNGDELRAGRAPDPALQVLPLPLPAIGRLPFGAGDERDLFPPLSAVCARVGARACALTGAMADGITPDVVRTLLAPVLDRGIDLVLPRYARHRLDGLINTGIVYPLTRALYGRRVDGQLGVDFGFSTKFLAAIVDQRSRNGYGRPIWLLTEAAERGMSVGQAHLGRWLPPLEQAADVSTALAQVLGSLFDDMTQHAAVWQRARGSQPVPTFGEPVPAPEEPREVDVAPMIESFRNACRNLGEIWGQVLPPATLVELNRISRLAPDAFRMPDRLWARIVFDFALGHRLRAIGRDHVLRAMTPLYLAWVASFALEVGRADRRTARDRLEQLCGAFEAEKPYLLARWRWPDRFNP